MRYLLSLPKNAVSHFKDIHTPDEPDKWFAAADPEDAKVGSGGGAAWLLNEFRKSETAQNLNFEQWLKKEQRMIIHGGGQSRRVPAYAPMGKAFLPVPVFSWVRGQKLSQTLLDLQLPLLEKILHNSSNNTLIASGDVLILSDILPEIPEADVVVFGMSANPELACRHGIFVCSREHPTVLEKMLQKPDINQLRSLNIESYFLLDTGLWLLSPKAVSVLFEKTGWNANRQSWNNRIPNFYDLYGTFGISLGLSPSTADPDIAGLTTAVAHLKDGSFYHFGTSQELVSSNLDIQNKVQDPNHIYLKNIKPHPAMFIQNAEFHVKLQESNRPLWIENAFIPEGWKIHCKHVLTGIPENDWEINLPEGICIDFIPISIDDELHYCIRVYGWQDTFTGSPFDESVVWQGESVMSWFTKRELNMDQHIPADCKDIQLAPLFPVLKIREITSEFLNWLFSADNAAIDHDPNKRLWMHATKYSASDISDRADLGLLEKQRRKFRADNLISLTGNYQKSVFYQLDLDSTSREWIAAGYDPPNELDEKENEILKTRNLIFRHKLGVDGAKEKAFTGLRKAILTPLKDDKQSPACDIAKDQIIWGRSPVRIDLAGGWTDTPPYCLYEGGSVLNIALELNGQPPLQAFIKPNSESKLVLRSIDLGSREIITSYEQLSDFVDVGSPFSIAKAAICLSGFHPDFCSGNYKDLGNQLKHLGGGFELTFIAALPKGSGMGTSSILAATILGVLGEYFCLNWSKHDLGKRTLALEQLLTTGGGWQDQYGGVLPGVKLLETSSGFNQDPKVLWLPSNLFTENEYKSCMLLYYTGITRIAKKILAEIVEGMFLNSKQHLDILQEMKIHTKKMAENIQVLNYNALCRGVAYSWELNNRLDSGTTNPEIQKIISGIQDFTVGYKLAGAGGGGFLFILAKDPFAAIEIKRTLQENPPNNRARFVDMQVSPAGFQVSKS